MKKIIYVLMLTSTMTLTFTACNNSAQKAAPAAQAKAETVLYTCPMHPEIVSNKPGNCPKCGMTLVEKKATTADTTKNISADSLKQIKK